MPHIEGRLNDATQNGVFGGNDSTGQAPAGQPVGNGIFGLSNVTNASGVFGANNNGGSGVTGVAHKSGAGVAGFADDGAGVTGTSAKNGVVGQTKSDTDAGVNGRNDGKGFGVFGGSANGSGVEGHSVNGPGVVGYSQHGLAGRFLGDVEVTGDIRLVNADLAEDFAVMSASLAEPGTVMALNAHGELQPSQRAYEKGVVGVISGAGNYKPAIVMDKQETQSDRQPIALVGKAYCKVDAQYGAVRVGDLLTTSDTPGHAMKALDPLQAFGAVIGKALLPLENGRGLIPILVALQ